jgi:hypothetical protein
MVNEQQRAYFYDYVEAWDDHDLQRIMAQFAEGGDI